MALIDNKLLFDIVLRLQVLTESVKVTEGRFWDSVLLSVEEEFRKLLSRVRYERLDALTKLELNKLVISLRQSQYKLYSVNLAAVMKRLEAFMMASLKVKRISYAWAILALENQTTDIALPTDEEASDIIEKKNNENEFIFLYGFLANKKGSSTLWPKIINEPIAANGALPKNFITSLTASAQLNLENTIRKGYGLSQTPREVVEEGIATLAKVRNQADAVMATTMQHIASIVSESLTSGLFGKYQWLSVIDGATTPFCRATNGRVFVYGKGPRPPAHIRCRSSIMPLTGSQALEPESYFYWINRQTPFIQNAALGNKVADMLRKGNLKSKDLQTLANPKAMTIEELAEAGKHVVTIS